MCFFKKVSVKYLLSLISKENHMKHMRSFPLSLNATKSPVAVSESRYLNHYSNNFKIKFQMEQH